MTHVPSDTWRWKSSGGIALALVLVATGVGGVLLRLWLLGNAPLNSDEATAGLIAHQVLHGHTYAFFWGQSYGGVEPYVLALTFSLFGQSPFVVNATPALLALVGSVLVWRIGLRLFSAPAAAFAGILCWAWSESALWDSVRETGYHQVCVTLGLVVLLQAVRIGQSIDGRDLGRVVDWAIFGAAGGLGFWASPEIAYFAVPSVVVVALALRGRSLSQAVVRLSVASLAAVIGALPWIWTSIESHGTGLPSSPVSYASRVTTFSTHTLPMLLGLRVEGAGAWEGGRSLGLIAYLMLLVFLVTSAALLAVRVPDARILVLALVLFPFIYAAFPTSWFWNDGRYALALSPLLALTFAGGLWQMLRPQVAAWVSCALLIVAMVSTLVAFNDGYGVLGNSGELTAFSANPNPAITSLAGRLSRLGVTHAYAGYWVANDLTLISGNRVTALALGESRNQPGASNAGGTEVAWIYVPSASEANLVAQLGSTTNLDPGSVSEASLSEWLTAHRIPYRMVQSGGFDVIIPSRNVSPAQVGDEDPKRPPNNERVGGPPQPLPGAALLPA
jgi:hypothetical protein